MNEKLMELIKMDDAEFYDEYVSKLSLEDQAKFFEEFPEFMDEDDSIVELKDCYGSR